MEPRARLSCSHAHAACDFQADLPGDEKIRGCWRREANAAHADPSLAASGIGPLPGVGGSKIAIEMGSDDQAGAREQTPGQQRQSALSRLILKLKAFVAVLPKLVFVLFGFVFR